MSGFVSIATGRTRGTEDVDILIPKMDQITFQNLFNDLQKHEFWCYQGDHAQTVYPYIKDLTSIRFAKKNEMFPNMEFISFNEHKKLQFFEFQYPQKIRIKDFEFKIPPLEFEILYKEIILKGQKDLEDAKHLRTLFSDILKRERFKKFEEVIKSHG